MYLLLVICALAFLECDQPTEGLLIFRRSEHQRHTDIQVISDLGKALDNHLGGKSGPANGFIGAQVVKVVHRQTRRRLELRHPKSTNIARNDSGSHVVDHSAETRVRRLCSKCLPEIHFEEAVIDKAATIHMSRIRPWLALGLLSFRLSTLRKSYPSELDEGVASFVSVTQMVKSAEQVWRIGGKNEQR